MTPLESFKQMVAESTQWNDRFEQYFPKSDDLVTTVLRGHLLLEEILEELLRNYAFRKEEISAAKLSFFQKSTLAKAFVIDPLPPEVWDSILALNSLRNAFAHSLEPTKVQEKIARFTSYRKATAPWELQVGDRDVEQVGASISWLLGQLSVLDLVTKYMESCKKYG